MSKNTTSNSGKRNQEKGSAPKGDSYLSRRADFSLIGQWHSRFGWGRGLRCNERSVENGK